MYQQSACWLLLWLFWFWVSRNNHPNLTIDAVATSLLVATFACAVYVNHIKLIPSLLSQNRPVRYVLVLMLILVLLALACTLAIHLAYDVLWGPDPLRFGFLTNFAMEFALVAAHVGIVGFARWCKDAIFGTKADVSIPLD